MEFYLRVLFYPEVTSRAESSSVKNRNCRILEMCRMFSCFSINPIKCRKGALSGLRQFLATETPLKMIKNGFCFTPNLFCSHDVLVFVSTFWSFRKKITFKIYVATWETTDRNIHVVQYFMT